CCGLSAVGEWPGTEVCICVCICVCVYVCVCASVCVCVCVCVKPSLTLTLLCFFLPSFFCSLSPISLSFAPSLIPSFSLSLFLLHSSPCPPLPSILFPRPFFDFPTLSPSLTLSLSLSPSLSL